MLFPMVVHWSMSKKCIFILIEMSRVLQPRRVKVHKVSPKPTEPVTQNSIFEQSFDEMKTLKDGNQIIDLSGGASMTHINPKEIQRILDMNTDKKADDDIFYEDTDDISSEYKQRLLKNMISSVERSRRQFDDNDRQYNGISYEQQAVLPSVATNTTTSRYKRFDDD